MTFAGALAVRHGCWPAADLARQTALLQALGLPTRLPNNLDVAATLASLNLDKKRAAGRVRWVLPTRIGHAQVDADIPAWLVSEMLGELLAAR